MKLIAPALGIVLGFVVLAASPVAAAVTITCPQEVMVNIVGKKVRSRRTSSAPTRWCNPMRRLP